MLINKAIVGAVLAALTVLVAEGRDTLPDWLLLLVAAVITGVSVWWVPNRDLTGLSHGGGRRRSDAGQSPGYVLLLVLAVVGVVYVLFDLTAGRC